MTMHQEEWESIQEQYQIVVQARETRRRDLLAAKEAAKDELEMTKTMYGVDHADTKIAFAKWREINQKITAFSEEPAIPLPQRPPKPAALVDVDAVEDDDADVTPTIPPPPPSATKAQKDKPPTQTPPPALQKPTVSVPVPSEEQKAAVLKKVTEAKEAAAAALGAIGAVGAAAAAPSPTSKGATEGKTMKKRKTDPVAPAEPPHKTGKK